MASQSRSGTADAIAAVSDWAPAVADRAIILPFTPPRAWAATGLRCELVVAAYLLWMSGLWLSSGLSARSKWASLDLLALAYLAVVAFVPPVRRLLTHWFGRLVHGMALLWAALPLAYRQSGYFGTRFRPSVEAFLIRIDRSWFGIDWRTRSPPASGWTGRFLETVYLSNYALVLGGISALLLAAAYVNWRGNRRDWSGVDPQRLQADVQAVLTALLGGLLACYALFPLLPAVTPRLYFAQLDQPPVILMRQINGWFLSRDSIPWGIVPCAHVAGIAAMGVAFWARGWVRVATFYLCAAALTAVATVYGDYHFACDAAAGALFGITAALALVSVAKVSASKPSRRPAASGQ